MLLSLDIRDMLLIDRLELDFRPGLNVLTGETGAGKSILLDCLGFVLGWRGRADLVRSGAEQGEVVAEFALSPDHPARAILTESGFGAGDTLLLRRVNGLDGRKTAWINDRRASGEVLRALSEVLVELHGQQDDKGLLNPRNHRAFLDTFAGLEAELTRTRADWAALRKARKAQSEAQARLDELTAEEEFLRHAVAELDALDPQPDEEAALDSQRRLMQQGERLRQDLARAHQALSGEGAERLIADALRWLEDAAEALEDRLDTPLAALGRVMDDLADATRGIEDAIESVEFSPGALEATEERLFAMRGLARKHGVLADELHSLGDSLRARLALIDGGSDDLTRLADGVAAAEARYDASAAKLTAARAAAAEHLDAAMQAELVPLRMDRAQFTTRLTPADPGPDGRDAVQFVVRTNPGAPAGALDRIASGGELSRFLLALKVCLARGNGGQTMIFDEIDRGVGGATADAVGRRLQALAAGGQVLVVTHSPQVAALGAHHWRVEKRVRGEQTLSQVVPLSADERIEEIARMLAGDSITEAARAAARALLPEGAAPRI